jgi:lactose/L-arabinose transport system substrate-binding protein
MKARKLVALGLTAILSLGLVACGGDKGKTADTKAGTENASVGKEKKVIKAWAWDKNFNIAALEEAEKIYEAEHPDVDVQIVEFAQGDIVQKLNTSLSAGSTAGLPNIVLIEDYRIQTFLKSYPKSFAPLTSAVKAEEFSDYKLDFMTMDGEIYGVPFDTGATVLFYRRDLIKEAGYTDEDMQDLTWEKYIEIGKAVKEKTGVDMLTIDPNDIGQVRVMMQSAGSWYVKEDGVTPNIAGNAVLKEELLTYKGLIDAGITKTIS